MCVVNFVLIVGIFKSSWSCIWSSWCGRWWERTKYLLSFCILWTHCTEIAWNNWQVCVLYCIL